MDYEIWKPTELYFPHIEVSNFGRVRSTARVAQSSNGICQTRRGQLLSPYLAKNGYLTIAAKVGDERKKALVHRLVAHAFVEGYEDNLTVNHIDGNKTNNFYLNLEWVTLSDNSVKEWETGLIDIRGEKHPSFKISDDEVRDIKRRLRNGEKVKSIHADYAFVSISLIYKISQGVKKHFIS